MYRSRMFGINQESRGIRMTTTTGRLRAPGGDERAPEGAASASRRLSSHAAAAFVSLTTLRKGMRPSAHLARQIRARTPNGNRTTFGTQRAKRDTNGVRNAPAL